MDRNSRRTSVVIEVANQEEPDDQKTYQIDFDDLDIPKDYIIDQIFCGENITVYALFEVPEETSVTSNDDILKVAHSKTRDNYRFFHQNSPKKIMKQTKLNEFRQGLLSSEDSSVNVFPNKDKENGSFYCLRHLSGDYDMLTPERESSDLKVLYDAVSRHSKSKFKAISKGVNTDIVQSPRIINEVQKAVKQSVPFSKTAEVKPVSSSRPSYEVIEMEMRQSFSSLSSYDEYKKQGKGSVPNFFLVPLLMMEDGVLSHFQSDEKLQKSEVEKDVATQVVPKKVSKGTNTDFLVLTALKNKDKKSENYPDVFTSESDLKLKELNSSFHGKLKNKANILSEIKKLQGKLNALIKSIESDDFDLDTSELESSGIAQDTPSEKSKTLRSGHKQFRMTDDDLPALSTLSYPTQKNEKTKQNEKRKEEHSEEVVSEASKSISISLISGGGSSKSQITRTHSILNYPESKSKENGKKFSGTCSIIWSKLENHKSAGLSKSATNNHMGLMDAKLNFINGVKKSFSFDLKDVKLEMTSFKKIKNNSFKLDTKLNIRIPQIGEAIMKCEMGDEICNKQKTSKIDLLSFSKNIEEGTGLKLAKKDLDPKKDEGDAKMIYSKENILSNIINRKTENVVHFCNTINTTPKDNILINEKNVNIKSKGACNNDIEKIASDVEKPTTPNKNSRKLASPNNNSKKEVKTVKKISYPQNKVKSLEKNPKTETKDIPEPVKQRSVTGSRKFTLKGSAESKLHVDRLMKSENSKLNPEKPGSKSHRLPSQKREQSEPPEENKEKVEKIQKTNSPFLSNRKELKEESEFVMNLERIGEDSGEGSDETSFKKTTKQSGVVVELFSKKPSEILISEETHKCRSVKKTSGDRKCEESSKLQKEIESDGSLKQGKSIVKSVWALTKVLLFEDGSKKMEILEASLTPPGYSLPKNSSE